MVLDKMLVSETITALLPAIIVTNIVPPLMLIWRYTFH